MKRNHSGKVRFLLNVITGEVKYRTWEKKLTAEWIDVGAFYKFATLKADFNESTNTWTITRGKDIVEVVYEWYAFSDIEPDYFKKIIIDRVTKKLTR